MRERTNIAVTPTVQIDTRCQVKRIPGLLAFLALAIALATPASASGRCEAPHNLSRVSGTIHCLAIKTYARADGSAKTLAVVLHGDLSRGGDADYIFPVAERAASLGAMGVAMMRPGYRGDGRQSSGVASRSQGRWERYTADDIGSIAAAVAALKKHHRAERVVMVDHSGGALISGVMIGRAAPLVDAAVLIACPGDVVRWRWMGNRKQLPNAESPHDYLSSAPKSSRIFAVTGENDRNTMPSLAQKYVQEAKAMGLEAKFVALPDAGHGFRRIGQRDAFHAVLRQAIDPG